MKHQLDRTEERNTDERNVTMDKSQEHAWAQIGWVCGCIFQENRFWISMV